MRYDFKPISTTSWIVSVGGNKQGLCALINETYHLIGVSIAKGKTFESFADMEKQLKIEIQIEEVTDNNKSEELGDISGFPVKHAPFNITEGQIPTYTKTATSDVLYAAGYWVILFPNGWTTAFSPKKATLEQYQTLGPFKTKLEATHVVNQEKNKSEELQ